MTNNLTLIGVYHTDLKGRQRLKTLLDHIAPEILTLEASEERIKENNQLKNSIRSVLKQKGINEALIERYIQIPPVTAYEWDVCEEYAKQHKLPLYQVDTSNMSPEELDFGARGIKKIEQTNITNKKLEKIIKAYEKIPKKKVTMKILDFLRYNPSCLKARNNLVSFQILGERDIYMFNQILDICNSNPNKRIVHVGGNQHMVKDEKTDRITLAYLFPEAKVCFLPYADTL